MNLVKLNEESVDEFWNLRLRLFEELGEISENTNVYELERATKEYYSLHINKDLISWGVFDEGTIAASGSLCLFERIPYHENLAGREGYILNIYTCPEFRNRGIAGLLLNEIIKYASKHQIKRLWLNSSEAGKSLYFQRGFTEKNNEMELFL